MPGIFGGAGCAPALLDRLEADFHAAWGALDVARGDSWRVGGHRFGEAPAVQASAGGSVLAVDGEPSLYAAAACPRERERLFTAGDGHMELAVACRGNLALLDPATETLRLGVEWSGSFPLYYARAGGGLLFSSRARPLARTVGAEPDGVGIRELLHGGYTMGGRTAFRGVHRLLPGQSLGFEARTGSLRVRERSRLWTDSGAAPPAGVAAEPEEAAWELLCEALRAAPAPGALMMSGGWDSRTLFAALHAVRGGKGMAAYAHGDVESRELELVARISRSAGVECRLEPVDDRACDLDLLRRGFERVENVVFPHWHRAGAVLAGSGFRCVTAGVYGEVLGGHYGPAMLLHGRKKVLAVARALLGRPAPAPAPSADRAERLRGLLRVPGGAAPWYLAPEHAPPESSEAMDADLETALERLRDRGISDPDRLAEAFVSEHRGTQYINAQLLSCRASLDVVLPFASRELLALASRVPLTRKIHNALNRAMLRRHAPGLLRYPMAATLVPAGSPLLLQEASRALRRGLEQGGWALHARSGGRLPAPRLGWVNFEFLRTGGALRAIVDDLRADLWNRPALWDRLARIGRGEWPHSLHPTYDQLAKIYTVDLMLR
ncbi:MAG TPA: hypothetical protein VFR81_07725 [Longimicrobium sp.]|nr:hypothetical protein [Longimicrobium sp.]